LAAIYHSVGFNATALHWYQKAEELAIAAGDGDTALELKSKRLEIQASGGSKDPLIPIKPLFPTRRSAGLLLENQPSQSAASSVPQVASQSGTGKAGCLGAIVTVFVASLMVLCAFVSLIGHSMQSF
jgi:hypothetical protein